MARLLAKKKNVVTINKLIVAEDEGINLQRPKTVHSFFIDYHVQCGSRVARPAKPFGRVDHGAPSLKRT